MQRRPSLGYFALAFVGSWACWGLSAVVRSRCLRWRTGWRRVVPAFFLPLVDLSVAAGLRVALGGPSDPGFDGTLAAVAPPGCRRQELPLVVTR